MSNQALFSRLQAIASRDLAERSISPGEAAYLVKVLTEIQDAEPASGGEAVPDDGEDFNVVRQALIDSGTPTSGPHDGGLHPIAQEALRALERLAHG